jgi:hypothetical protein
MVWFFPAVDRLLGSDNKRSSRHLPRETARDMGPEKKSMQYRDIIFFQVSGHLPGCGAFDNIETFTGKVLAKRAGIVHNPDVNIEIIPKIFSKGDQELLSAANIEVR